MALRNLRTLIVLDDDSKAIAAIEELASEWFTVAVTRSPARALNLARGDRDAAAILVEQQLSSTTGLAVLKVVQSLRPDLRRVLMTGPGHLAQIIDGLHSGAVSAIVYKPVRSAELAAALNVGNVRPKRATA